METMFELAFMKMNIELSGYNLNEELNTLLRRMHMKKWTLLFIILLLMNMSGCEEEYVVRPITRDEDYFEVYYEGEEYTIMRQIEIDTETIYPMIAYGVGDGYFLGAYHRNHYYVEYDKEYYYLDDGVRLGLYTGEDLKEVGIEQMSYMCHVDEEK